MQNKRTGVGKNHARVHALQHKCIEWLVTGRWTQLSAAGHNYKGSYSIRTRALCSLKWRFNKEETMSADECLPFCSRRANEKIWDIDRGLRSLCCLWMCVCFRFSSSLLSAVRTLNKRQRACFSGDKRALNTFWLPAQTVWSGKRHMHAGTRAHACKFKVKA